MKYTTLGNTGIKVSRICVGCMSYGEPSEDFHLWTLDQPHTQEMVKYAIDRGINFFDTANCYSHGTSETFLGKSLKNIGIRREDVVLASKVYFNEGCLSRAAIMREIDGTLSRLGTDYLDLYQIHRFDFETPIEETMEALHDLVRSGNANQWGAGYPSAETLTRDIEQGGSYVCIENGRIVATFFFQIGEEPTYKVIESGEWLNADTYGVIHRVATDGSVKCVMHSVLDFCFDLIPNIRIDTHRDNKVMQNSLLYYGFQYCGIIHLANGAERLAYQLKK